MKQSNLLNAQFARRLFRTAFSSWQLLAVMLIVCMNVAVGSKLYAQSNTIAVKGKVMADGEPVIGATVLVKGVSTGTATDMDGNFSLNVASKAVLVVSSIGYETQEVPVNGRQFINVVLKSDVVTLKDVVVVGYGVQKKVNLTGAVSSVSTDELEGKPISNVLEAMQGTTPGLVIQQGSSTPGSVPSINIRGLKRVAADFAGEVDPPQCAPSTGKKIAILGGGPGGLSAAYYLQLMGHQTTVYEMLPELGGMLRYGIPNYRLPKERLDDDIRTILKAGVQVKNGLKIGQDITIQELRQQYDVVLITIGASTDKKLGLENEDADGIISAVQFLRNVGKNQIIDLTGKEVVVIGGGNVSMDAVRTAKRLGAKKVSIVYRRRVADMTALPGEIEGAVAEGIELQTLKAPASIDVDENHHVKGIYVTPQMVSSIRDGRASIKPTGEEDIYIPCDVLIVAIGQNIETHHFEQAGIPVERGKIITKSTGAFENLPGVFAGGDCASGPASVIKAIAAAKVVAANIDEYLGYHHEISCDVEIPEAHLDDRTPCGRVNLTEREACERVCDFEAVENCMTEKEAKQEASRCLRCDHFGYGIFKGGRETLW